MSNATALRGTQGAQRASAPVDRGRELPPASDDSESESEDEEKEYDADEVFGVDAIKYAIYADHSRRHHDGKKEWRYGIMWNNYLKSTSDTEESRQSFIVDDGKGNISTPMLDEFWKAAGYVIPKGAVEPRGKNNELVETPIPLMKSWIRKCRPRRDYDTYVQRRAKERNGESILKRDSDFYWHKKYKKAKALEAAAAAQAAATNGDSSVSQVNAEAGPSRLPTNGDVIVIPSSPESSDVDSLFNSDMETDEEEDDADGDVPLRLKQAGGKRRRVVESPTGSPETKRKKREELQKKELKKARRKRKQEERARQERTNATLSSVGKIKKRDPNEPAPQTRPVPAHLASLDPIGPPPSSTAAPSAPPPSIFGAPDPSIFGGDMSPPSSGPARPQNQKPLFDFGDRPDSPMGIDRDAVPSASPNVRPMPPSSLSNVKEEEVELPSSTPTNQIMPSAPELMLTEPTPVRNATSPVAPPVLPSKKAPTPPLSAAPSSAGTQKPPPITTAMPSRSTNQPPSAVSASATSANRTPLNRNPSSGSGNVFFNSLPSSSMNAGTSAPVAPQTEKLPPHLREKYKQGSRLKQLDILPDPEVLKKKKVTFGPSHKAKTSSVVQTVQPLPPKPVTQPPAGNPVQRIRNNLDAPRRSGQTLPPQQDSWRRQQPQQPQDNGWGSRSGPSPHNGTSPYGGISPYGGASPHGAGPHTAPGGVSPFGGRSPAWTTGAKSPNYGGKSPINGGKSPKGANGAYGMNSNASPNPGHAAFGMTSAYPAPLHQQMQPPSSYQPTRDPRRRPGPAPASAPSVSAPAPVPHTATSAQQAIPTQSTASSTLQIVLGVAESAVKLDLIIRGGATKNLLGLYALSSFSATDRRPFEVVDRACLEMALAQGGEVLEWVNVAQADGSKSAWDKVTDYVKNGRMFICYDDVDSEGPFTSHKFVALVDPKEAHLDTVGLNGQNIETMSVVAIVLSIPVDGKPVPMLPNPVHPDFVSGDAPEMPPNATPKPMIVAESYGFDSTMANSMSGGGVAIYPSHKTKLWTDVRDQFMKYGLEPPPQGTPPATYVVLNSRWAEATASTSVTPCLSRRTQIYGYGPDLHLPAPQWRMKEMWKTGGLVTFSPTLILRSPDRFVEIMDIIRETPGWAAYIVPTTILWAQDSWGRSARCPDSAKAFSTLSSALFMDDDLHQMAGSGGGLAVTYCPPQLPQRNACTKWLDWLRAVYECTEYEPLVELCKQARAAQLETRRGSIPGSRTPLPGGNSTPVPGARSPKMDAPLPPLDLIDVEKNGIRDLMAMRQRPHIVPYRRYIYIGPVSNANVKKESDKFVEFVAMNDFEAVLSGAV